MTIALPVFPTFDADVAGHRLRLITDGNERRRTLIGLIDGARTSVHLFFYMFLPDSAGRQVLAALMRAARRGIDVSLIVDSFGSGDSSDAFFAKLARAGGRHCYFSRRWTSSYLIRNHQKLALIDGATLMTGGFNIADDYLGLDPRDPWHDLGLVLTGPATARIADWLSQMEAFVRTRDGKWRHLRRMLRAWDAGDGPVRLLAGGPTQRLSPWAKALKRDIDAGQQLDMIMAYFSPGQSMIRRIGRIAARGRARLVMAAKSDNGATIGAARLLYGPMLKRGTEIWEYRATKLHMKLIVIDNAVYIGSANMDMRSLFLNLELMIRFEDAAFAGRMRDYIASHAAACDLIDLALHRRRRTLFNRVRWSLAWLVVGALDYTVARRLNFGIRG